MKGFPDLPPIWLLAASMTTWILAEGLPLVQAFGPVFQIVGWGLVAAGLAGIVWSALWFRRKRTTIEPHHTPSVLIVEGPYRISRNPIYLGMVLISVGYVLMKGALSPVLVPVILVWVLSKRFIEPEEHALRQAFGADAESYLSATRRWL